MKLKKLIIATGVALISSISAQAGVSDVRVYINPGHGSWTSSDRPCGTVKHGANNPSTKLDTTAFFETNTNIKKTLYFMTILLYQGVPADTVC